MDSSAGVAGQVGRLLAGSEVIKFFRRKTTVAVGLVVGGRVSVVDTLGFVGIVGVFVKERIRHKSRIAVGLNEETTFRVRLQRG